MTIGQLIETITGKGSCLLGSFADCTAFEDTGMSAFRNELTKKGYHSYGNEVLYDGLSGHQIEADIFIGPTYYMRLKHMVKDKINHRAGGPRDSLTRQTVQGRANDGGLRIGEMERDALVSHGIMTFLKNSMVDRGDKFYLAICNHSGTIAIFNSSKNIMFSPYVDGPIVFDDTDLLNSEHCQSYTTQFGKEFSIIQIPYSLKLLMQELTTINVQMRIITSDNIDSLTTKKSKSFSVSGKHIREQMVDTKTTVSTNLSGKNEDIYEIKDDNEKNEEEDNIINEDYDYNNLNETIVQHTIFNVGDTVVYVPSKSTRPWKIKEIDNSKKHDNIIIFTLLMGDLSDHNDLPANSVIQNKILNKSNQTLSTPVFLTVSIEDIVHFAKDGKLNNIAIKNTGINMPNPPNTYENIQQKSNQENISELPDSKNVVKIEDDNGDSGNNEENNDGEELKTIGAIKTIKLN